MSIPVPHRLLERAVRRFELESARVHRSEPTPSDQPHAPEGSVITISRQLGSGGRLIAEMLGEWLGWQVWDRQILDALATVSSRQLQSRMFEALDEHARRAIDSFMTGLFKGGGTPSYHYLLPKAILIIAQQDAIIVGRGAHLYLPQALKIRVVAPEAARVENVVRYDGVDRDEALHRIHTSDHEREAFRRDIVQHLSRIGRRHEPELEYDLLVNTAQYGLQASADLVRRAAEAHFGLLERTPAAVPPTPPLGLPVGVL